MEIKPMYDTQTLEIKNLSMESNAFSKKRNQKRK